MLIRDVWRLYAPGWIGSDVLLSYKLRRLVSILEIPLSILLVSRSSVYVGAIIKGAKKRARGSIS